MRHASSSHGNNRSNPSEHVWSPTEMAELTVAALSSLPMEPSPNLQVDLNQIDQGLNSEQADEQLEAARKLRHLLSSERDLLIRQVLEKNWTPKLIEWLQLHERPTLQVEALWALTNIAAGATDNTSVLLQHGAIPTLVSLLESPNEEVLEQSVWVLGNLAGEGPSTRDLVLAAGALPALVSILRRETAKLSLLRIVTWTVSNLCDGQPRPVFSIGIVLPDLGKMLKRQDTEILSHVCWALSHLCDGPSTHIQSVVNSEVCRRLVELLGHRSWRVTKPALRAIGNIVCAEDDHDYTQHIIDCGAVPSLRELIAHSNREIQKEACWTLSNIAAGTVDQIQCVLDSGSIPLLIKLASAEGADAEVKSEACWVVLNATSCGSDAQIEYLVKEGCITVIKELLQETSMIMMALEGLERILQVGEMEAKRTNGPNPYTAAMACIDFKLLSDHKSPAVSKRTNRLWQEHFVKCAICELDYSKQSNETHFCDECKCFVCKNCDCTVFHLKYQESLWKEETEKESNEKQAKIASKRSKRQKKRQRTKERKALLRQQQRNEETDGKAKSSVQNDDIDDHSDSDDESESKAPAAAASESGNHATSSPEIKDTKKASQDKSPAVSNSKSSTKSSKRGNMSKDPSSNNSTSHSSPVSSTSIHPSLSPRITTKNGTKKDSKVTRGSSLDNLDKMINANDELVSYLNETGSIMALAKLLEEEDDEDWILAEKQAS